jgi:hypothetical protein
MSGYLLNGAIMFDASCFEITIDNRVFSSCLLYMTSLVDIELDDSSIRFG